MALVSWNAHVASGTPFAEYGKYFETFSVCFFKGLGAPVGSMILSSKSRIAEARIWRKRYGAGMRQIGLLLVRLDYALDHNIDRLKIDHQNAAKIAEAAGVAKPGYKYCGA
jgi:threonine aldolase